MYYIEEILSLLNSGYRKDMLIMHVVLTHDLIQMLCI